MSATSTERVPIDVAVGVLIDADGRFLMTSRPEGKVYAGYWEFPGGKVEPGETIEQALRRELHEEIGITIGAAQPGQFLMLRAGEVVSKTDLTEHLYDQDFDRDSNVIEVFVGRLRKKLDPDGRLEPIETLRGRGYRLTLARADA